MCFFREFLGKYAFSNFTCIHCLIWRGYVNVRWLRAVSVSHNRAKALLARKINVTPSLSVIIATAPLEYEKMAKGRQNASQNTFFFSVTAPKHDFVLFGAVLRAELCRTISHLSANIFTVSEDQKSKILDCFHFGRPYQKIDEKKSIFASLSKFLKIGRFLGKKPISDQISFRARFVSFW